MIGPPVTRCACFGGRPVRSGGRPGVAAGKAVSYTALVCIAVLALAFGGCTTPPAVGPSAGGEPPAVVEQTAVITPDEPPPVETPSDPEPEAEPIVVGLVPAPHVDLARILADSHAIDSRGARTVGSPAERKAAVYVAERLKEIGYEPVVEEFPVPGGTSRNVVVRAKGADARTIVLGAHLDSKKGSPGANDDAVGCAILLEAARLLASRPAFPTVELVFFGSEEYNDGKPRDHHRGSRFRVKQMSAAERAKTAGMISVDVIGYGNKFHVRTMGVGPRTMSDYLLAEADRLDVKLTYLKDPGPTGWSDHEPYEKAGIPAAWLERLQDPAYHKAGDVTSHLQKEKVREAAQFTLDVVYDMGAGELAMLRP
jgi:hypothetical protein